MNYYILYAVLLAVALFEYYIFYIEPRMLRTEVCVLNKNKDALKLIQLSDLHLSDLKVKTEDINKVMDREKPDIVAITGDMLDIPEKLEDLGSFLSSLSCPCPIYITLGNHDQNVIKSIYDIERLRSYLTKFPDTTLLHNDTAVVYKGTAVFDIIGIPDTQSEQYSPVKSNEIIAAATNTKIVLTHNPDAACDILPGTCHIIISGHLHGGQIWMPFRIEFSLLRKDRLPKRGYKKGLYTLNDNKLYISRGIGTSFIPARFLSRPEITVFYL
jgi:uncharacterized protein